MKTTTFTLTSVALGLIVGVSATHYHQVSRMVETGAKAQSQEPVEVGYSPQDYGIRKEERRTANHLANKPGRVPGSSAREDALLELLAEMRKEQKMLRAQLAETNREMSELTFRVDTHSDSFKPLRTDSQRPIRLDTGSPQVPIDSSPGVLPPVPRGGNR